MEKEEETKGNETQTKTESKLKEAQELRRLIGDPRVRVEVPTMTECPEKKIPMPISQRYQVA